MITLPFQSSEVIFDMDGLIFDTEVLYRNAVMGAATENLVEMPLSLYLSFREGWIDQLYVLAQYQGQGAGNALLKIAKAVSDDLQLRTFRKKASARQFCEARGFAAINETDCSQNEEREPDILYRREKRFDPVVSHQ
jgi:beta-phosphoglucomutase-like phosphatase (HAD superfamily)